MKNQLKRQIMITMTLSKRKYEENGLWSNARKK